MTVEQGRSNQSYILKGEDLWKTVMKYWEEILNEVLVRVYSLHHQIVNTMIANNGNNDFLYERVGYTLDTGSNLQLMRMEEEYIVFQLTTILTNRIR